MIQSTEVLKTCLKSWEPNSFEFENTFLVHQNDKKNMNKHEDHENMVKIIKIMCVEGGGLGGGGVWMP